MTGSGLRVPRAIPVAALMLVTFAWTTANEPDPLLYVVEGDRITFTNQPARDARPVPGLEPSTDVAGGRESTPSRPLPTTRFDPFIELVAHENGLSPELVKAVALVESGFNPRAVSRAGAQGLMQLMPATARDYGVEDPLDPLDNLRAGARHLRDLLEEFDGDLTLALAAYNAGSGAVRRYNGVPNYPETVNYVRKVHERLGREPPAIARRRPITPARPIRFKVLDDGSVMLSN